MIGGKSRLVDNRASVGSTLQVASAGQLLIAGSTVVDMAGSASGIKILAGGNFSLANEATMTCTRGERLLNNVTTFKDALGTSWGIDCSMIVKLRDKITATTTIAFANPTCSQLGTGQGDLENEPKTP